MGRNRHNLEVVRTIALLAQNLRLDVIAEGVETPEQLAQLRAIGCDYAQGYLFSRPLTAETVRRLLAANRVWWVPRRLKPCAVYFRQKKMQGDGEQPGRG